jgi:hypothetical protein
VLIFVNSFSFIFLEFLANIYWANFFSQAKNAKKGGSQETGPDRPMEQGGPAGPVRPAQWGPGVGSPRFFPKSLLFDFLLWSENFKRSLNKENAASRAFLFGLFIWPNWELGNPSHLAFFCTHTVAMVSPNSVELKRCQEAIDGGGEAIRAQATSGVTYQKIDCFPMCEFSQKFKTFCLNMYATKFYPICKPLTLKFHII